VLFEIFGQRIEESGNKAIKNVQGFLFVSFQIAISIKPNY